MSLARSAAIVALASCLVAWPSGGSAAAADPSPAVYGIELQEAWIPMPDGIRLSADLFLPQGGEPGERFPVLLEYLPYRKIEDRGRNYSL